MDLNSIKVELDSRRHEIQRLREDADDLERKAILLRNKASRLELELVKAIDPDRNL